MISQVYGSFLMLSIQTIIFVSPAALNVSTFSNASCCDAMYGIKRIGKRGEPLRNPASTLLHQKTGWLSSFPNSSDPSYQQGGESFLPQRSASWTRASAFGHRRFAAGGAHGCKAIREVVGSQYLGPRLEAVDAAFQTSQS
jgi:hypothetical protein